MVKILLSLGLLSVFFHVVTAQTSVLIVTKDAQPFSQVLSKNDARGYSIDLVSEMMEELYGSSNVDISITTVQTNPDMISFVQTNATSADIVIGAAATTITAQRETQVHFLPSFFRSGLRIMTPTHSSFFNALTALVTNMLLTCGMAFFGILLLIFMLGPLVLILEVKFCPEDEEYAFYVPNPVHPVTKQRRFTKPQVMFLETLNSCKWVMFAILGKEYQTPRNRFGDTVKGILQILGIMMLIMMTATLTTAMTSDVSKTDIQSYDDLSGKTVCTVSDTSAYTFLDSESIGFKLRGYDTIDLAVSGLLDHSDCEAVIYDQAILQDTMVNREESGKSSHAVFVDTYIKTEMYGFFVNESTPTSLFEDLQTSLLTVLNDPDTMNSLEDRWLQSVVGEEFSGSFSFSQINIWVFLCPLLIGIGLSLWGIYEFFGETYDKLRKTHAENRRARLANVQNWQQRFEDCARSQRGEGVDMFRDMPDLLQQIKDIVSETNFTLLADMSSRFGNKNRSSVTTRESCQATL